MMTNSQAQAYAVVAMTRLGYDRETIRAVEREMYYLFDVLTEEEAEEKAGGIKAAKPVCECCGSTDDVADVDIHETIEMCRSCRVTWYHKTRFSMPAADQDNKQKIIEQIRATK